MKLDLKIIKTEQQHEQYLSELESLLVQESILSQDDSERLEMLTVLIEAYEKQAHPVEVPDPIDAILFRMEEKGLRQVDLVPYFGTRSRVSEVLSRKRPMTVPMIRAVAIGLGISADTLVGINSVPYESKSSDINWSKFPSKEMIARGWINKISNSKQSLEEQVQDFIAKAGWSVEQAAFKRTISGDAYSPASKYALYAWLSRVIQTSRKINNKSKLRDNIDWSDLINQLVKLSWFDDGPVRAVKFLEENGIVVVIEPALKGTQLDGAALKDIDGTPIIGLTLRYDRLDNFWFTLIHEVVHIWKHIGKDEMFMDDMDSASEDKREAEANRIARDSFIPRMTWKRSEANLSPSYASIDKLSRELKISPAIIAGRIRREKENYRIFNDLIGQGEVRHQFIME